MDEVLSLRFEEVEIITEEEETPHLEVTLSSRKTDQLGEVQAIYKIPTLAGVEAPLSVLEPYMRYHDAIKEVYGSSFSPQSLVFPKVEDHKARQLVSSAACFN